MPREPPAFVSLVRRDPLRGPQSAHRPLGQGRSSGAGLQASTVPPPPPGCVFSRVALTAHACAFVHDGSGDWRGGSETSRPSGLEGEGAGRKLAGSKELMLDPAAPVPPPAFPREKDRNERPLRRKGWVGGMQ